jgi:hypothetical protein
MEGESVDAIVQDTSNAVSLLNHYRLKPVDSWATESRIAARSRLKAPG